MPNVPIDKDLNEPLMREGVRVTKKVNGQIVTEIKDIHSGEFEQEDLLAGITDNDLQGPLSGLGERSEEDFSSTVSTFSKRPESHYDAAIESAAASVQRREIVKNAIKAIIKQPEVKAELIVDWYDDPDYREAIAETVLESYGTLGITKKEILETINQIYN